VRSAAVEKGDGQELGDLRPAPVLRHLAGDRYPRKKGVEDDRGQCRGLAVGVGRAVIGNEKAVTLRRVVSSDRR